MNFTLSKSYLDSVIFHTPQAIEVKVQSAYVTYKFIYRVDADKTAEYLDV